MPERTTINTAIQNFVNANANAYTINTDGYTFDGAGLHYVTQSIIDLGFLIGEIIEDNNLMISSIPTI